MTRFDAKAEMQVEVWLCPCCRSNAVKMESVNADGEHMAYGAVMCDDCGHMVKVMEHPFEGWKYRGMGMLCLAAAIDRWNAQFKMNLNRWKNGKE